MPKTFRRKQKIKEKNLEAMHQIKKSCLIANTLKQSGTKT